jgi:outer membrane protein assembly factor BamD
MKKILFFLLFGFLLVSCKTEFETIRTSGDPELIYKQALEYYEKGDYYKAQSLFELAIPYYRGKELAEELYYKYSYTFYNTGEYILASHYFTNFARTFYNSPKKEEMEYMSAYAHYEMSPNYKLDQTYTVKAIEEFQRFANTHPASDKIPIINKHIDEMRGKLEKKAFESAKLYYDIGQFQAAVQTFSNVLKDFPGSDKSEEARFLKLKSAYILADNSIYEKKEERFDETIVHYNEFIKKHPKSKRLKDADEIYQNSIKELKKFGRV